MPQNRKKACVTNACLGLLRLAVYIVLTCLPGAAQSSNSYLSILVANTGSVAPGFSGDGGPAIGAQFEYPGGLAVDNLGNLYIADCGNYRIRKISPQGIINTIAGDGTQGFSGDNGPATAAELNLQYSQIAYSGTAWYYSVVSNLAVDSSGTVYIVDGGNYRVRKVTPQGIMTTIAGNGVPGYSGDGGQPRPHNYNPLRSLLIWWEIFTLPMQVIESGW